MPIDFDALVLGPCMATFGEPITVDPLASQPGQAPYQSTGIFSSRSYEVSLPDGSLMMTQITTLGVQLSQFVIPPAERDVITVGGLPGSPPSRPYPVQYIAADVQKDGQGGMTMTLRKQVPPMVTS